MVLHITKNPFHLLENALHGVATTIQFLALVGHVIIFKLEPPHRNKFITTVTYLLQPSLTLLVPNEQSLSSVADGLMSIGHILTPVPKHPWYSKHSSVYTIHVDFHI